MSGENIHRLEGGITTGGLVIRKKKGPDEDEDDPKNPSEAAATGATTPMRAPTASVLGLDRLAAVKREREAIAQRLREKESDIEEKNREGQELALNELFEPPITPGCITYFQSVAKVSSSSIFLLLFSCLRISCTITKKSKTSRLLPVTDYFRVQTLLHFSKEDCSQGRMRIRQNKTE